MRKIINIISLLFAVSALAGCGLSANSSDTKWWKPGRAPHGQSEPSFAFRSKTVLIHYVNETATSLGEEPHFKTDAAANFQLILEALDAGAVDETFSPRARDLLEFRAEKLRDDATRFPAEVEGERSKIERLLCGQASGVAVAFFSNRLSLTPHADAPDMGTWKSCDGGGAPVVSRAFSRPDYGDNGIANGHPLTRQEGLEAALAAVRAVYPPAEYQYILVTKSHGSNDSILLPKVFTDFRGVDQRVIQEHNLLVLTRAGTQVRTEPGHDPDRPPGKIGLGGTGADGLVLLKGDFVEMIKKAGEVQDMQFPLILLEACSSALEYSSDLNVLRGVSLTRDGGASYAGLQMNNVGLIYGSDEMGLPYVSLDYETVTQSVLAGGTDFVHALHEHLEVKAAERR